mmetsp:Transcript_36102/g.96608  ORF Transcript_36102/g.96608 Transcript_36102/m.96608 type:complete len:234 (+) Transcript_36102:1604-2305(+)
MSKRRHPARLSARPARLVDNARARRRRISRCFSSYELRTSDARGCCPSATAAPPSASPWSTRRYMKTLVCPQLIRIFCSCTSVAFPARQPPSGSGLVMVQSTAPGRSLAAPSAMASMSSLVNMVEHTYTSDACDQSSTVRSPHARSITVAARRGSRSGATFSSHTSRSPTDSACRSGSSSTPDARENPPRSAAPKTTLPVPQPRSTNSPSSVWPVARRTSANSRSSVANGASP